MANIMQNLLSNPEIVGYAGGMLSVSTLLPQVVRTCFMKTAKDISLGMFLMIALASVVWITYGVLLVQWPIITTNVLMFLIALAEIVLILRCRRRQAGK